MYKIAIPKGSLLKNSLKFLEKNNIKFEMTERKLLFETSRKGVEVLIVRPTDVVVYVEKGAVDLGIVGSDIIDEYEPSIINLTNLNYGHCNFVVAVPNESPIQSIEDIPDYARVATKFTNMTKKFFRAHGISVDVISLYGSIEIAPLTGLSDLIVDLVGTGKTLRENGLRPICTISEHTAHLIANRVSWQLHHEFIKTLNP